MFFRQMLMSGAARLRTPEDDQGSEFDDPDEELGKEQDEQDDQDADDESDESDDLGDLGDLEGDDESPAKPARKPFAQRVEEVADRKVTEKLTPLQQEVERLRAQVANPQAPQDTPDQVQTRINAMDDPFERMQAQQAFDRQQTQATLRRIEFQSQDAADKASYESLAARAPVAAKLKDEVERRLAEMRAQGTTAPRETVLRWVIGDRALAQANRATGRATRAADANRTRQTSRPSQARGDATHSDDRRGNSAAARAKRLENIPL